MLLFFSVFIWWLPLVGAFQILKILSFAQFWDISSVYPVSWEEMRLLGHFSKVQLHQQHNVHTFILCICIIDFIIQVYTNHTFAQLTLVDPALPPSLVDFTAAITFSTSSSTWSRRINLFSPTRHLPHCQCCLPAPPQPGHRKPALASCRIVQII